MTFYQLVLANSGSNVQTIKFLNSRKQRDRLKTVELYLYAECHSSWKV